MYQCVADIKKKIKDCLLNLNCQAKPLDRSHPEGSRSEKKNTRQSLDLGFICNSMSFSQDNSFLRSHVELGGHFFL